MSTRVWVPLLGLFTVLWSGCAVLIGTVPPVAEKSDRITYSDLSQNSLNWSRIDKDKTFEESKRYADQEKREFENEFSDVAFQSKATASIISFNTACRPSQAYSGQTLESYANLLFLGVEETEPRSQKQSWVAGVQALETQVIGKAEGKDMKIQAYVFLKEDCLYDVMYVSRVQHFDSELPMFQKFVSDLRFKSR